MTDTDPGNMTDMAALLRRFFHDRQLHVIERAVFAIDRCEPRYMLPAGTVTLEKQGDATQLRINR